MNTLNINLKNTLGYNLNTLGLNLRSTLGLSLRSTLGLKCPRRSTESQLSLQAARGRQA
jgi:hypothetical protein